MKIYSVIILALMTIGLIAQKPITNHVIVIDNTGSMRGKPDNKENLNIWDHLTTEKIEYISKINYGNKVTLYSFDEDLSPPKIVFINSEAQRNEAMGYVKSLQANGLTTCLYTALYKTTYNLKRHSSKMN